MYVTVESKTFKTEDEAKSEMDKYYGEYPSGGYGTSLRVVPVVDGFRYIGGHWDSCD